MPMTVAEMAERAGKHGASREAFIQRMRHWTRERLLLPLGEPNPGTGKHRVYDEVAIYFALILEAMTNKGIPIATQRDIVNKVREEQQKWGFERRAKGDPDLLLAIETYPWRSQVYFHEGMYTTNEHAESVTIFNLTKLFAVLQPAAASLTLTPSAPVGSVTTNKREESGG